MKKFWVNPKAHGRALGEIRPLAAKLLKLKMSQFWNLESPLEFLADPRKGLSFVKAQQS